MIYKLDQIFVIVFPNTPCRLVDFPTAVRELYRKFTVGRARTSEITMG